MNDTRRYVVDTCSYSVREHTYTRETSRFIFTLDSDSRETRWRKDDAGRKLHTTWGAAQADLLSRIDYNIQYYQEHIDKLTRKRGEVVQMPHPPL